MFTIGNINSSNISIGNSDAASLVMRGGKIFINNVEYIPPVGQTQFSIVVNGNVVSQCDKITIKIEGGTVSNVNNVSGDIIINNSITNSVSNISGNITINNSTVTDNIKSISGKVFINNCKK